ncbi:MAG TPA: GNAT family N-acetyltransferase [Acidimicrobiales bacterium]|nr:GNAT family N-acetyltransferase [Acidimicrobiales bacterium]
MPDLVIAIDDPAADDVRRLLERHLAFAYANSPPEHVHALDESGLSEPSVTFFSARRSGSLVGVGALKQLDETHGEIKSMHTSEQVRGQGVGRAMLDHLLAVASARGYRRVSLETGSTDEFAPARTLYASAGFVPCEPFAAYRASEWNTFMTLELGEFGERGSLGAR